MNDGAFRLPWYAAWPPRPPRDDEACPVCGYGLDDGTETEHECPPGFSAKARQPLSEQERMRAGSRDIWRDPAAARERLYAVTRERTK